MSKFIDAMRSKMTGRQCPIFEPLSVTVRELHTETYRTTDEYEFKVEWTMRGHAVRSDFAALQQNMFRHLQEAVYGDLRDRVLKLEQAMYAHKEDEVRMHIRDLLREVF